MDNICKSNENSDKPNKHQKIVTIIEGVEKANIIRSFPDQFGDLHVMVSSNPYKELLKLTKNGKFNEWLCDRFWAVHGDGVSQGQVANVINQYRAQIHRKDRIKLHNRICHNSKSICIDMSNKDWQYIKVTKNGWTIEDSTYPQFKRYNHQAPMKVVKEGVGNYDKIDRYLHIPEDDKFMIKCYIISCFIPEIDHPILSLYGEQGSAKSTIHKICKKLIDPSSMSVLDIPPDKKETIQLLQHHWYMPLDNLTSIDSSISNLLCRAVTGTSFSKRTLFSDDDDIIYSYKRCIGLNGINIVPWAPDLLDRCLNIKVPSFKESNRIQSTKLWHDFDNDYNQIMNGVLDILNKSLAFASEEPGINVSKFRMGDFACWCEVISRVMGYENNKFLELYDKKVNEIDEIAIKENLIGCLIQKLVLDVNPFKGSVTALYMKLKNMVMKENDNAILSQFPKDAIRLSKEINKIAPNLRKRDIIVDMPSWRGDVVKITNKTKDNKDTPKIE